MDANKTLKMCGLVVLVILALSITIKEKPIFTYIYQVIAPATRLAQSGTERLFGAGAAATKEFSKKLFENSVPKVDSVKSKLAAPQKQVKEPQEKVEQDDRAKLDDLIKSYN